MSLVPVDQIDQTAVLRALGLDAHDPRTQAMLLICQRYDLDPLLKHVVLIKGRPYITRDGYLHVAHQSGQFDGIEITEEGETTEEWWARAAVYRKDMGRPFTYRGRYPKRGAENPRYGPEMAVKTAEVMAMRRAFNVSGMPAAEEAWDAPDVVTITAAAAKSQLLSIAGGDKEAASEAWDKAGLKDRRQVSEEELEIAVEELRQLGWSWAPVAGDDPGDDEDPDPEPPEGPGDGLGAGVTADREAAAAGNDGAPTPAPSSGDGGGVGGPSPAAAPRALNARDVAMRAQAVFRPEYDAAPRGQKTKVVDLLRHAVLYATTQKRSLNDLDPGELARVWNRLEDIAAGRLTVTRTDTTVTFTTATSGKTVEIPVADLFARGDSTGEAA